MGTPCNAYEFNSSIGCDKKTFGSFALVASQMVSLGEYIGRIEPRRDFAGVQAASDNPVSLPVPHLTIRDEEFVTTNTGLDSPEDFAGIDS
jgi:hypothetical protein